MKRTKNMGWSDISINKHNRIVRVYRDYGESDDLVFHLVAACYDMTFEQVLDLPYTQVQEMVQSVSFLSSKPKTKMVRKEYEINGRKYEVQMDMTTITTAQYIDFQQLAPKCEEHMPQFLSIILIPEGKTYNSGYNIEFVQNEIGNHFNVEDTLALSAFFLHLYRKSISRATKMFRRMRRKAVKEGKMTQEQMEALMKVEETIQKVGRLL